MAFVKIDNVAIRGFSACVPPLIEENRDLPFYSSVEEAEQVIAATGIERRHIATKDIAVSDLCTKAAEKLIAELGWDKESIDLLVLVTQNADYINHPTSFVVHDRLGLSENTICLDLFHGCPGWVIGMTSILPLISSGCIRRALFLDGDTISKDQDALSREDRPLFGDAATATALEYDDHVSPIFSNIGTKSDEGKALIKPIGGWKTPFTPDTLKDKLDKLAGLVPPSQNGDRDSMDVFSFAITKVPKAIKKLSVEYCIPIEKIDSLVLHQANKLILEAIAKRLKVPMEKVPLSLKDYGNTTSASIPLTIVSACAEQYRRGLMKTMVCGFGQGLSWGAMYFETERVIIPEIIVY